jgi:hypothetical protein
LKQLCLSSKDQRYGQVLLTGINCDDERRGFRGVSVMKVGLSRILEGFAVNGHIDIELTNGFFLKLDDFLLLLNIRVRCEALRWCGSVLPAG